MDSIDIRKKLEKLSEQKLNELPDFYQRLATDIDNELQRLETLTEQVPEPKEIELKS